MPSPEPFLLLGAVFGDPELGELFSERALVESWLQVERMLAAVQAEFEIIPREAAALIEVEAVFEKVNLERLREGTRRVGYPIVPLIEQITAGSPAIVGDYLHWGATTQDIMDTGLVLQLSRGLKRIEELVIALGRCVAASAEAHRTTVMPARTHGQQAVPTTFGVKLAVWLDEFRRHLVRLDSARERVLVVQLFGAAGTAAALGPLSASVRRRLAERLEVGTVDVPWHTARDNLAELAFVLASIAATCGKVAREIIDLSRTEIAEVREQPSSDHGPSSTMPQKVNPVLSEAVLAMSALARDRMAGMLAAMQGTHERSAGEWQIEWDALPTLLGLTAGALKNILRVLETLQVFPVRMRANLEQDGGLVMSEAVMMALAPRMGRLRAHELVTAASRTARAEARPLADVLAETLNAASTGDGRLAARIDPEAYLGEASAIVAAALASWSDVDPSADPVWSAVGSHEQDLITSDERRR
jgi:3-carboxy-cis,cis-muconate cycloisomerase